jgi:tetratricopeptide (TPR) repeat protein
VHSALGRHAEAKTSLTEALEILSSSDRKKSLCNTVNNLGTLALLVNETAEARGLLTRALDLARGLKDPVWEHNIVSNLAEVDFAAGDVDRAIERARDAVKGLRSADRRSYLEWVLFNLAFYLTAQGDRAEARAVAEEALSLACRDGGYVVRVCLQLWALLAALDGRSEDAARLAGFVDAGVALSREIRQPFDRQIHERLTSLLATALPEEQRRCAAAEGAGWTERQAVEQVRECLIVRPASGADRPAS